MKLLNKHKATPEELQGATYIGRGSPLGNPFPIGEKYGTREDVKKLFHTYFVRKLLRRDPAIENAFRSLRPDSRLVCFCEPLACHGDCVIEVYNSFFATTDDYEKGLRKLKDAYSLELIDYNPADDGDTHINVWSKAKTQLGRDLSNFAHTPFDHPEFGHFASVEGFWYWLSTGMDQDGFRALYGFKSKQTGKLLRDELVKNGQLKHVEDFDAQIKKAILCKIEQNPSISQALKESTLPLTHYYVWGESPTWKVTYPDKYAWIHEFISDVRDYLQGKAHKLVIAGSRSIKDIEVIDKAYRDSGFKAIEIVSGRAPGVDRLGEELAKRLKLPVALFPADWENHPKAAGFMRNTVMAAHCTAGVLVWDGVSKGTAHMEGELKRLKKPYYKLIFSEQGPVCSVS